MAVERLRESVRAGSSDEIFIRGDLERFKAICNPFRASRFLQSKGQTRQTVSDGFDQPSFRKPVVQLVEDDGEDDDAADDNLAVVLVNAENDNAAADHLDDQRAEQCA